MTLMKTEWDMDIECFRRHCGVEREIVVRLNLVNAGVGHVNAYAFMIPLSSVSREHCEVITERRRSDHNRAGGI